MRRAACLSAIVLASCAEQIPARTPPAPHGSAAQAASPAPPPPAPREAPRPSECSTEEWAEVHAKALQTGAPPDASAFQDAACVARTAAGFVEWVTVHPIGALPFVVRVEKLPVAVLPAPPDASSAVEVGGALRFRGLAQVESLGVRAGVPLAAGMVRTGARTRVVVVEARGGELVADVQLADSITVERLSVPCSTLMVTEPSFPPAQVVADPEGSRAEWLTPKDGSIALFAGPSRGDSIRVQTGALRVAETRGESARVSIAIDDGGRLSGWAARGSLEEEGGGGIGYGFGGGGCGCPNAGGELKVVVPAGADVFAAPGRGRWASVTASIELEARDAGPDWIQLVGLRGLSETQTYFRGGCSDLEHAFVLRAGVRLRGDRS